MKRMKITLLVLIIFTNVIFTAGCWNYREIDKFAIVTGVAVDEKINGQYEITVEVIQSASGKNTQTKSKTITMEGKTMFDAVRNGISLSGKRLYFGHAKVIIISKKVAGEGITKVLDFFNRDSEIREDAHILISKADTAKEIFEAQGVQEDIRSFALDEMIRNQASLSKAPMINILQYDNELQTKGISPIAATVNLKNTGEKIMPEIMGTGIFKNDKLIGFLSGEETKRLMFIRNKVKGGVLIETMQANDVPSFITLEIFKNKTKVIPYLNDKNIKVNINIHTTVAIDEIDGTNNLLNEEGLKKLEQSVENIQKERIESLIKKVQTQYGEDIFGFGLKLWGDNPKVWKSVANNWEEVFKYLNVNVMTQVHIKNTGILSKSLEEVD